MTNKVIDRWETLINPEKEIPAAIFALTGITNEMVSDAPIFDTRIKFLNYCLTVSL
jgi:DNA polymerase-3 subunit epsilon